MKRGDVDRLTYQTVLGALSDARMRLAALAQDRTENRTAIETEAGFLLERGGAWITERGRTGPRSDR